MINHQGIRYLLPLLFCLSCFFPGLGQPTLDPDLKKPAKYENRVLRAEKTGEKKFTVPRRFFQNTYTHFNYAFNARNKLNMVLENAKARHIDRYAELLSFYNYTLEQTAEQKTELDSVIYKVNAGIFLHDLRSNWMDNIYLMMGEAYYYRNTLDTAFMTFQYINYAFSPKEADGYDKVIASNSNEDGNNLKVSTLEKRNLVDRSFSEPPSRNDALVWLVRTHITRQEMATAATLIQTLRNDPDFPKRLDPSLAEVTAYWFYNSNNYDSAAYYLEKALPAATNKQEMARWEYLLGQLYSRANKPEQSKDAFKRCIQHTLNPVMEVAAQLQSTQEINGLDEQDWLDALAALDKMARREKYAAYRDLIYFTMAKIEVRQKKIPEAQSHLLKSVKYSISNPEQKSRSYMLLGDLSFDQLQYPESSRFYDSVITSFLPEDEIRAVDDRKTILHKLVPYYEVIQRQDSLQKLADLPESERNTVLKKQIRLLRKQQGLKEDDQGSIAGGPVLMPSGNLAPSDLFVDNNSGEWYFYNNSLKSRGFTEFRTKWGNRPNTDNWRRSSSVNSVSFNKEITREAENADSSSSALSLESLTSQLPIGPEKRKISNDSILQAQYLLANGIQNKLEDYATAATLYEQLEARFPGNPVEADILYNLSICYRKLGRNDQLGAIVNRLSTEFPNTRQAKLATDPNGVQAADSAVVRQATNTYESIYNLFISGRFEEAIAVKAASDSVYGTHYWTPQLLYIEAIYEMRTRQDSLALKTLNQIVAQYPEHQLAERAANLADVLNRRSGIEDYLNNLQVERPVEDSVIVLPDDLPAPAKDSGRVIKAAVSNPVLAKTKPATDSTRLNKEAPVLKTATMFNRHAEQPHFVALVLDQVDPVYVNEARNAFIRYNKEKYYNQPMNVVILNLTDQVKLVAISGLANEKAALDYIRQAKPLAPKEIIPWLKGNKYYFLPVAENNMDLLISNKNLPVYQDFLKQLFPDQY